MDLEKLFEEMARQAKEQGLNANSYVDENGIARIKISNKETDNEKGKDISNRSD